MRNAQQLSADLSEVAEAAEAAAVALGREAKLLARKIDAVIPFDRNFIAHACCSVPRIMMSLFLSIAVMRFCCLCLIPVFMVLSCERRWAHSAVAALAGPFARMCHKYFSASSAANGSSRSALSFGAFGGRRAIAALNSHLRIDAKMK